MSNGTDVIDWIQLGATCLTGVLAFLAWRRSGFKDNLSIKMALLTTISEVIIDCDEQKSELRYVIERYQNAIVNIDNDNDKKDYKDLLQSNLDNIFIIKDELEKYRVNLEKIRSNLAGIKVRDALAYHEKAFHAIDLTKKLLASSRKRIARSTDHDLGKA